MKPCILMVVALSVAAGTAEARGKGKRAKPNRARAAAAEAASEAETTAPPPTPPAPSTTPELAPAPEPTTTAAPAPPQNAPAETPETASDAPAAPATATAPAAAAAPPLRIVVTDVQIRGEGIDPVVGESLSAVVAAEIALRAPEGAEVISRNELRQLVGHASEAQLLGCADPSCLVDFGQAASADQLVSTSISRVGEEWVLTLELLDVRLQSSPRRQAVSWAGAPAGLVELVRPYVTRLMEGSAAEAYVGTVEILTDQEGAAVRLDDRELGITPVAAVHELPIGRHRVSIGKEGFLPYQSDLVVHRNESTLLTVQLVDESSLEPWYYKWWVWGAAGAVIGGGVALAFLLRPEPTTTLDVSSSLP